MKQIEKSLLEDKIINISELVKKRCEYLGLESGHSEFLSKVFTINKPRYDMLTEVELAQAMGVNVATVRAIITPLISKGLVLIVKSEDGITFNFETLVYKLLDTYLQPSESASIEDELKSKSEKDESKKEQVKALLDKNWLE